MFSKDEIDEIKQLKKRWKLEILNKYTRKGEIKDEFKTPSGIPLKHIYDPLDIKELEYHKDLGYPGIPPYTRGVYPNMYRGRLWTMRQYSGFADATQTNKRFKYLITQGQKGLSIAFDLPTQMGYDPDNEICSGEIGRVGVSVCSLKDFEVLFKGISLENISTSMTINSPTAILLAMYIAVAEKQGVDKKLLRGTVQNDILKEYIARGTYIFPPEPSLSLTADIIEYCSKHLPRFNTISISGYHMREAGANAIQELAFTLANGICYVKEVLKRGIEIDDFAPRLSFFYAAQNNFLEEIAKFRAARRLWARIIIKKFKAKDPKSLRMRFHTQTAGVTLTAQQPKVNIIRVAIQALSSILGGTQSLHACGADEALGIPTKDSVRISLRTQQILAHESGLTDIVDPLGGSYYLEYLTNELEQRAMDYINKIEEMGGMPAAINKGYVQNEISNNAYLTQQKIESGEKKIIGVNSFQTEGAIEIETFKYDDSVADKKLEDLFKLKKERKNNLVKKRLNILRDTARTDENIMPSIIDAVKAYATIQEISDILREVFGEYQSSQVF
jgi:methylmalonyl-CoA mutase N-terminal domain/subunit